MASAVNPLEETCWTTYSRMSSCAWWKPEEEGCRLAPCFLCWKPETAISSRTGQTRFSWLRPGRLRARATSSSSCSWWPPLPSPSLVPQPCSRRPHWNRDACSTYSQVHESSAKESGRPVSELYAGRWRNCGATSHGMATPALPGDLLLKVTWPHQSSCLSCCIGCFFLGLHDCWMLLCWVNTIYILHSVRSSNLLQPRLQQLCEDLNCYFFLVMFQHLYLGFKIVHLLCILALRFSTLCVLVVRFKTIGGSLLFFGLCSNICSLAQIFCCLYSI